MKRHVLLLMLPLSFIEARVVSLSQLIDQFFKNNSQLMALKESKKIAESQYKKSLSSFFPKIDLNTSYTKTTNSSPIPPSFEIQKNTNTTYNGHIQLTQPLFLGGKLLSSKKLAQAGKYTAYQTYEKQKQTLLVQLLMTAYNLAFLKEQEKVLLASQKYYSRLVDLNQKKLKSGNALSYEYYQSRAELYSYNSRLKSLAQKKRLNHSILKSLLETENLNPVKIPLPTGFLEDKIEEFLKIPEKKLLDQAIKKNRDFLLAKKKVQILRLQRSLALSSHLPSLTFSYQYGYFSFPQSRGLDKRPRTSQWIFSLRIPLFSGLSFLQEKKIQSGRFFVAQKKLRHQILALPPRIKEQHQNLKEASHILQENRKWVASAKKAHKNAEKHFRSGRIGTVQMVQVQSLKERALLSYLQSLENLYRQLMKLQMSLGYKLEEIYAGKQYEK